MWSRLTSIPVVPKFMNFSNDPRTAGVEHGRVVPHSGHPGSQKDVATLCSPSCNCSGAGEPGVPHQGCQRVLVVDSR